MKRVTVNTNYLPTGVVQLLVDRFEELNNRMLDYSYGKPSEDDIEDAWNNYREQLENELLP